MRSGLASLVLLITVACGGKSSQPQPPPEGGSGSAAVECPAGSCGPALGMPAQKCSDGSVGGNTGRCLRNAEGGCGWEIRECPASPTDCITTGCSGTVCAEPGKEVITTCEMKPEYACYKNAKCERQTTGACGWTQTPELTGCLAHPPKM